MPVGPPPDSVMWLAALGVNESFSIWLVWKTPILLEPNAAT